MSDTPPEGKTHPWEYSALLTKATRYIEQMMEIDHDQWQYAFWSSLALELLARAALAKTSPTLLADTADWSNLYFALGHTPKAQKFSPKSIGTAEVLNRLQAIVEGFDKEHRDFCAIHTGMRNAELHSAETPFEDLKIADWQWKFFQACEILLRTLGAELKDVIGEQEAAAAVEQIKAAKDDAAKKVLGTVASYRDVWNGKTGDEQETLSEQATLWAAKRDGHVVDCPACSSKSLLEGNAIDSPKRILKDDLLVETQAMSPYAFQCVACGLKITGLSHLIVVGLGDRFKTTATYEPAEYYFLEPEPADYWEDDNNEPF